MKKTIIKFSIVSALILIAGIFAEMQAQSVSGSIGNGAVKRGSATRGTVVLSIPSDLHVNSNRPNNEYAIPTVVRVSSKEAKVGAVNYPRGKSRKFSFSDQPISVYDGNATFSFNVSVPANFKGNIIRVRAVVRYQACNDEVCFPPKEKEITMSAKVQ